MELAVSSSLPKPFNDDELLEHIERTAVKQRGGPDLQNGRAY